MTSSAPAGIAEISPVARAEAGQVLTPFHIWTAAGLTLLPIPLGLIGFFGGIGLAVYFGANAPEAAGVSAVAGVLVGGLAVGALVFFQHFLPSCYLRAVACRAFGQRSQPLVRWDDPEAEFVDIVPRSNWGRNMLEPATDVGFWRIDSARHELLFEGDNKRYRIPFQAVASCEVEKFCLGAEQWRADVYFVTVLNVQTATGPREIGLVGRHLEASPRRMPQRRLQAYAFCKRIKEALGAGLVGQDASPA